MDKGVGTGFPALALACLWVQGQWRHALLVALTRARLHIQLERPMTGDAALALTGLFVDHEGLFADLVALALAVLFVPD